MRFCHGTYSWVSLRHRFKLIPWQRPEPGSRGSPLLQKVVSLDLFQSGNVLLSTSASMLRGKGSTPTLRCGRSWPSISFGNQSSSERRVGQEAGPLPVWAQPEVTGRGQGRESDDSGGMALRPSLVDISWSDVVKSIPPSTENSMQYGYDENDNNNMSNETKRETNYSTTKWNDVNTHNYMQLTKEQQVHQ